MFVLLPVNWRTLAIFSSTLVIEVQSDSLEQVLFLSDPISVAIDCHNFLGWPDCSVRRWFQKFCSSLRYT